MAKKNGPLIETTVLVDGVFGLDGKLGFMREILQEEARKVHCLIGKHINHGGLARYRPLRIRISVEQDEPA